MTQTPRWPSDADRCGGTEENEDDRERDSLKEKADVDMLHVREEPAAPTLVERRPNNFYTIEGKTAFSAGGQSFNFETFEFDTFRKESYVTSFSAEITELYAGSFLHNFGTGNESITMKILSPAKKKRVAFTWPLLANVIHGAHCSGEANTPDH